ncbi:hypothetical protein [Petropleomorpha daqingensis]|uniref:Uncharacterized protein n=1 Tax=Petropleomorpha daqingensis TaxID=2026353 RepID=A0A853CIJ1_9ACTN|nr:hypothetical protein [Petropleomorpha daqingensis]NYJ07337.1 hypothetical protein [Petropleomorpha daqingensis]
MRNHTELARRVLDVVGDGLTLTALCFGTPIGVRRLTQRRESRR